VLKSVIMNHFTMNHPTESPHTGRPQLERDQSGCLYSPHLRASLARELTPGQLATVEAFAALRWSGKLTHHVMERWAEKQGLSEGRLELLACLKRRGAGVPLGELAEMMSVSPRNITGLIDNLERDGLVVRVADPNDRRSVLATLTEAGRERIESTWRASIERQGPMAEGLSREELIQLRHLCLRVVENMQQVLERGFTR
jgi:DNA-binding MarR family transcriptional regulator